MGHPQKDISRFVVFLLQVGFYLFTDGAISRLIPLHNVATALVDGDEVVVLKENIELFFLHAVDNDVLMC